MATQVIDENICPKCGSSLTEIMETASGKRMRKCVKNVWNKETKKSEGCEYVKWITPEPKTLDEACPKCGKPLVLQITRFGKKMKKCSTSVWDSKTKTSSGCDFVEWVNGTTEKLDEACPECGQDLVLFTTNAGKKMKKCSTAGWDKEARKATGCTYVKWLKAEDLMFDNSFDAQPPPPGEPPEDAK